MVVRKVLLIMSELKNRYPLDVELKSKSFSIRRTTQKDGDTLLSFANELPEKDIVYLRRDITQQPVIDAWLAADAAGTMHSLIAECDGKMAGSAAFVVTAPMM